MWKGKNRNFDTSLKTLGSEYDARYKILITTNRNSSESQAKFDVWLIPITKEHLLTFHIFQLKKRIERKTSASMTFAVQLTQCCKIQSISMHNIETEKNLYKIENKVFICIVAIKTPFITMFPLFLCVWIAFELNEMGLFTSWTYCFLHSFDCFPLFVL